MTQAAGDFVLYAAAVLAVVWVLMTAVYVWRAVRRSSKPRVTRWPGR